MIEAWLGLWTNPFFSLLLKFLRARQANARESVVSAFVKSREQDEDLGVFSERVTVAPVPGSVCQLKRSNVPCVVQMLSECDGDCGRS